MLPGSTARGAFVLMLLGLSVVAPLLAGDPPRADRDELQAEKLKPAWRVGDRWVVETATRPTQLSDAGEAVGLGKPVRWEFTVAAIEPLGGRECYRVEARIVGRDAIVSPATTFWADRLSLALVQVEAELMVGGGRVTITESYHFPAGQPAPVQCFLTALPVDMPVFLGGEVKGTSRFVYEAVSGPVGQKALGEVSFATEIEQAVTTAKPDQVKAILYQDFAKSLGQEPLAEVRLKSAMGRVRQLWQPGSPWPVYAENNSTTARLVSVTRAASLKE